MHLITWGYNALLATGSSRLANWCALIETLPSITWFWGLSGLLLANASDCGILFIPFFPPFSSPFSPLVEKILPQLARTRQPILLYNLEHLELLEPFGTFWNHLEQIASRDPTFGTVMEYWKVELHACATRSHF